MGKDQKKQKKYCTIINATDDVDVHIHSKKKVFFAQMGSPDNFNEFMLYARSHFLAHLFVRPREYFNPVEAGPSNASLPPWADGYVPGPSEYNAAVADAFNDSFTKNYITWKAALQEKNQTNRVCKRTASVKQRLKQKILKRSETNVDTSSDEEVEEEVVMDLRLPKGDVAKIKQLARQEHVDQKEEKCSSMSESEDSMEGVKMENDPEVKTEAEENIEEATVQPSSENNEQRQQLIHQTRNFAVVYRSSQPQQMLLIPHHDPNLMQNVLGNLLQNLIQSFLNFPPRYY